MRRVTILILAAIAASAQALPHRAIEFTVAALDAHGKPVTDLRREEFSIVEEGQPRDLYNLRFDGGSEEILGKCDPGFFTNRSGCASGPPRNFTLSASSGLEAHARHMASATGRKNLIWTGELEGSEDALREAARRVAAMGVSVYPVAGPHAELLADVTGGRVSEDAAHASRLAANDTKGSYTLEFFGEGEPDGRWHEVAVGVSRRGVKLIYKQGYVAERAQLDSSWTELQWGSALSEKITGATLHLDANCDVTPVQTVNRLSCRLQIADRDVGLLADGAQWRGDLEVELVEKSGEGHYQTQQSHVPFRLTAEQVARLELQATTYAAKWSIGTAIESVRLIVHDRHSDHYAILDMPLAEIPAPRAAGQPTAPYVPPPDADPFIERARETALSFLNTLPNYVVRENTTREQMGPGGQWKIKDRISAEIVYENGRESTRDITLNGEPATPRKIEETGTWSTGQFAGTLKALFDPASKARFRARGAGKVGGHAARVYSYVIERVNSGWVLSSQGRSYVTAYHGTVWLDAETARTLRFEMKSNDVPGDFPLARAESSTEFGMVHIGSGGYLLPENSVAMACNRVKTAPAGPRRMPIAVGESCARNVIQFSQYKQFGVESNISFGPGHVP